MYEYRHKITGKIARADFNMPVAQSWHGDKNSIKITLSAPTVDVYFEDDPQGVTYSQSDFYNYFEVIVKYPHAWKACQNIPLAYAGGD